LPRGSRSATAVAPAPARAAKPPKPIAQPKAKLRGPRLRSIWENAPERVPVPDLPRLPRSARRLVEKAKGFVRQKRVSCAACPAFLELFAGSARFTSAMIEKRFRVLPAFELLDCQAYDLSSPSVQCLILCWLLSGRVWFVHLAPPCKDFSVAKSTGEISEMSRSFVLFSCVMISVCLQNRIGFISRIHEAHQCGKTLSSLSSLVFRRCTVSRSIIVNTIVCTRSRHHFTLTLSLSSHWLGSAIIARMHWFWRGACNAGLLAIVWRSGIGRHLLRARTRSR
jgi:hypothetical protein